MMPAKIISIIGARPQFIKHAPVQLELQKHFHSITVHTGQHYDQNMSDVFFNELKIPPPDYMLGIHASMQGEMTGAMMTEIEKIVVKEKPDAVLVYGDTNSTLAGALVAAKLLIPLIHIEAGLRSFNKTMPEEINRIVADHCASLLFCPSEEAIRNLEKENIKRNVYLSGDVMKDMLELTRPFLNRKAEGKYVFVTLHRPYNTDNKERLQQVLTALDSLDIPVILPLHPRTHKRITEFGMQPSGFSNISFTEPVGYIDSLSYQAFADMVITDSGGMQKEAYWLGKKCITLRSETEWIETTANGWNTLVWEDFGTLRGIMKKEPGAYNRDLYSMPSNIETIAAVIKKHISA